MPQKQRSKKSHKPLKPKRKQNFTKNIRKVVPKEEKANLKNLHLNALKKGDMSITKVINKNIETVILAKAKIGFIFVIFHLNLPFFFSQGEIKSFEIIMY